MKKVIRLGARECQLVDVMVDDKPAVLVRKRSDAGKRVFSRGRYPPSYQ